MRFSCDSCQAKYQIADEKVAGKTVRMKCRKCGHAIQVRARRTADGVEAVPASLKPPPAPDAAPGSDGPAPPRPDRPGVQLGGAAARGVPAPPRPGGATDFRGFGGGGAARAVRPFGPSAPLKKDIASPGAVSPTEPDSFDQDEATTVMQRPSLEDLGAWAAERGGKLPTPRPAAGRPAEGSEADAEAPDAASPEPPPPDGPEAEPPPEPDDAAPAEVQWFVGIAGTPVGPKPVTFLEEKIAAGIVDGDSLVWHEEMPDWKPLRTVSELEPLLAAAPRPATTDQRSADAQMAGGAAPTVSDASDEAVPAAQVSDPLALMKVKQEQAAAKPSTDDAARARPAVEPASLDDLELERRDRRRKKRRRGSPLVYAFIAMAGGFGAVAAYVVFASPPEVPPGPTVGSGAAGPSTATRSAAAGGGSSVEPVGSTVVLDEVQVDPGSASAATAVATVTPGSDGTAGTEATSSAASDIDTSGFDSPGPSGPSSGPSGDGDDESRSQLTTAEIQGVVNRYKGGVSRRCLPMVEAGSPSGATSARVVAHLTVGPSGRVVSASASGGKDFPGLTSCVAGRVRSWRFPASSGTTRVDVPFHFIAQ